MRKPAERRDGGLETRRDAARDDLRAAADAAARDAERIAEIEREKAKLSGDDPAAVVELSAEASKLGRRLERTLQAEAEIAREVDASS